jgi:hypothetical protein
MSQATATLHLFCEDLAVERLAKFTVAAAGVTPLLIHVAVPRGGGAPSGRAFLRFRTREDAAGALTTMSGAVIDRVSVRAEWAHADATSGYMRDATTGRWRPGSFDVAPASAPARRATSGRG